MRKFTLSLLNAIARGFFVNSSRIHVGKGSKIAWRRIGAKQGILDIGENSIVQCRIDFDSADGHVVIGDRCFIGASHLVCHTRIEIAEDVIISWGVTIVDHNSHSLNWKYREQDIMRWIRGNKNWEDVSIAPVHIESKVWIGFGATILKGVTIGEGAVVGAMSVVTRDVPAFTVVAGNPAKVIRNLEASALSSID